MLSRDVEVLVWRLGEQRLFTPFPYDDVLVRRLAVRHRLVRQTWEAPLDLAQLGLVLLSLAHKGTDRLIGRVSFGLSRLPLVGGGTPGRVRRDELVNGRPHPFPPGTGLHRFWVLADEVSVEHRFNLPFDQVDPSGT